MTKTYFNLEYTIFLAVELKFEMKFNFVSSIKRVLVALLISGQSV